MKRREFRGEEVPYEIFFDDYLINIFDPNKTQVFKDKLYDIVDDKFFVIKDGETYIEVDGSERHVNPETPFTYTMTMEQNFRSKNFKKFDPKNTNVLYAGCSVTWGLGMPEDLIWTTLLEDKLKALHDNIVSYNLSMPGWTIDVIIKNIMSFIKQYGKPDYLMVMMPDINRSVYFSHEKQKFLLIHPTENWLFDNDKAQIEYTKFYRWQNNALRYIEYIRMLEAYCKEAGIELIWTTWQFELNKEFNKINFDYFIPNSINDWLWHWDYRADNGLKNLRKDFPKNVNNLPYWYIARDGQHPGSCWTTTIAEEFYQEILRRKNEKIA